MTEKQEKLLQELQKRLKEEHPEWTAKKYKEYFKKEKKLMEDSIKKQKEKEELLKMDNETMHRKFTI